MNSFNYEYPVRQHFGKGCAESAIKEEMKRVEAKMRNARIWWCFTEAHWTL